MLVEHVKHILNVKQMKTSAKCKNTHGILMFLSTLPQNAYKQDVLFV